jgi:tRNA uracil 4-sulfurtransferase
MIYLLHTGEIAIKGANRHMFEDRLIHAVAYALRGTVSGIWREEKRVAVQTSMDDAPAREALARVFGVEWFSGAIEAKKDPDAIAEAALQIAQKIPGMKDKSLAVVAKRADKSFPMTSMQLAAHAGAKIKDTTGCRIDLEHPDVLILIEVLNKDRAYVMHGKYRGPGGLPCGSGGRAVSLLSGGIDSPVASWMMMKRGMRVELLHVHPYPTHEDALKGKIAALAHELAKWQSGTRLTVVSHTEFYMKALSIPPRMETVMFRMFCNRLAEKAAERDKCAAVITGDSLGQVASQTVENITAASLGLKMPVFRPLIGLDKREIIAMAEKIGTYNISLLDGKDCCSLISPEHPETRADSELALRTADDMKMDEIVEKALSASLRIEIAPPVS